MQRVGCHVRVFTRDGSTWTQRGADIVGQAANDQFGYSVALSAGGNTLAAGARQNDDSFLDAGSATVYRWS